MRALRCNEYGSVAGLVVEDLPDPLPGVDEVVVDIAAAAVNFPDVLLIADQYQIHVDVPFTPGSEFAGTVRAVGAGASGVAVGDRVVGAAMVGAFAEQIAVPASSLRALEPTVDLRLAAAFGVGHRTAYLALRTVAGTVPGDWVVVLGAAGGVGLAAVELAHVLGGRVLAAASSEEKLAVCRQKGAEATVNYQTEDLKAVSYTHLDVYKRQHPDRFVTQAVGLPRRLDPQAGVQRPKRDPDLHAAARSRYCPSFVVWASSAAARMLSSTTYS